MNSSVYSADRATHLRILAVALAASIAIVGFVISVRVTSIEMTQTMNAGRLQKVAMKSKEAILASPTHFDAPHLRHPRSL